MANPMRKALSYLGLAEEEEYDEQTPAAPAPVATHTTEQPAAQPQRAAVTPLRRSAPRTSTPAMSEILTVHPRQYRDAQAIAEAFREGIPVIINLSQMTESDARRLIDFASGLSQGLYGRIERVTSKVFLLSPEHVAVSGESGEHESETEVEASFFTN